MALVLVSVSSRFSPAAAQVITDGRLWTNLSVQERQGTISPWRWSSEFVLRTRDGVDELDVLVLRGLLGYDVTPRSSAWMGFAVVPSFPAGGGTLVEKRLFEQYLWSGHGPGGSLALRTRLEQRWAETNSGLAWRVGRAGPDPQVLVTKTVLPVVSWRRAGTMARLADLASCVMVALPVPPQRSAVNPVRPGREQPQR